MKRLISGWSRATIKCGVLVMAAGLDGQVLGQTANPPPKETPALGGLEEITVTARRREENLQSVPVSVTVLTPAEIARAPNTNVTALTTMVAGLSLNTPSDPTDLQFGIRGQQFTFGTLFPGVIPYLADVPLQRVSDGVLFDLSSVQVLKGPQGTLFGRVTDGGAILLTPQRPTDALEGWGQMTYGNFNEREIQGAVNAPLVPDKLSVRLSVDVNRRDGYTKNLFDGRWLDDKSYEVVRLGVLLKPNERIEDYILINLNHADQNGFSGVLTGVNPLAVRVAGHAAALPSLLAAFAEQTANGPRVVDEGGTSGLDTPDHGIFYKRQVITAVNTLKVAISPLFSVKNITGYIFDKELQAFALSPGPSYFSNPAPFFPNYFQYYRQWSNETQLQGQLFDGRVDVTTGAYFDRQDKPGPAEALFFLFGSLQLSQQQYPVTTSSAGYGQIGVKIVDGLKFDAGIRYTKDRVSADSASYIAFNNDPSAIPHGQCLKTNAGYPKAIVSSPCIHNAASFGETTYSLGLDYQVTKDLFLYAADRKGYRPGGFNVTANPVIASYQPETLDGHEIGLKADWRLGEIKLRTNVAAFYDNYQMIQQQVAVVLPGQAPFNAITNVSAATIKGLDLETTVIPIDGLTLNGAWTYLDAAYDRSSYSAAYIAAACPANPLTTAADPTKFCPLQPMKVAPKHTVSVNARYVLPTSVWHGELSVGGHMYHVSKNYDAGNITYGYIPSYSTYDADIEWNSIAARPIDIRLFVNNLTDKTYITGLTNLTSVGQLGFQYAFFAPPRMFGASVRYHFGS